MAEYLPAELTAEQFPGFLIQVQAVPLVFCDASACPVAAWQQPAHGWPEQHYDLEESDYCLVANTPSDGSVHQDTGSDFQDEGLATCNPRTALRRRQRRHRTHRRAPPVLKLPLPTGSSTCVPQSQGEKSCAEASLDFPVMMKDLGEGGAARVAALQSLQGSVWRAARNPEGCRAVQLALEVAPSDVGTSLLAELSSRVREAVESPYANYVVQKAVEVFPGSSCSFIVEELCGISTAVARHRYGCRVLCRLLEHGGHSAGLAKLVAEVLTDALELCHHPFGHHVMQAVLEHGLPEQRRKVQETLSADLFGNAQHRCASHLVEAALIYSTREEQLVLAADLLASGANGLAFLAQSQFGSFVVRVLLRMPGETGQAARSFIMQEAGNLWPTKYGQRVMADLTENGTST